MAGKSKKKIKSKSSTRRVNSERGESVVYNAPPASDTDTEVNAKPSSRKRKKKKEGRADNDDYDDRPNLERKPSPVLAPLPILSGEEFEIFQMVRSGNIDGVKDSLGKMNINKIDRSGYTLLHYAVSRQDEEMVKLLLSQPGIKVYDTVLHAIREGNLEIAKLLLEVSDNAATEEQNHDQAQHGRLGMPAGTRAPSDNFPISSVVLDDGGGDDIFDSEFPPVITPLMLAAKFGSQPLMDLFYERNERLETQEFSHNKGCECKICSKLEGEQDMTRAFQRIHLFEAITTPEYICFIARKEKIDPVRYAIQKIIKLRNFCERDMVFDEGYEGLIERLEEFIEDLVGLCRSTLEIEIFLSPKDDMDDKERLPHLYPRLWYAVGLDLRKFVAHSHVQNIVYKAWSTDDWPEWETYGFNYRLFNLIIRIFGFPFIGFILMCGRNTKLGKILGAPVSRYLTFLASYLFFLGLVAFQVLYPYQRCPAEDDEHCNQRGPPNMGTEWPIILYVMSFYLSILKRKSVSWYWSVIWNWFELLTQLFFTGAFICWLWAWIWIQLPENQDHIFATERQFWPYDCAEVIGECFISAAAMFSFGRLFRYAQVVQAMGPIMVGMGRLVAHFVSAVLIYTSVVLAFASGLLALYVPYKGFEGLTDDGTKKEQDDTFTQLTSTLKNLFYYLVEAGDKMEPVTLLSWPADNTTGEATENIHHDYTEYTGKAIYFMYHVVGRMMMVAMLSGFFAQAFAEMAAKNEEDVNWKFSRTELYLTFIKDTVLPPPMNLLPTVSGIKEGIRFLTLIGKKNDPKAACSSKRCCYITTGSTKKDKWRKLLKGYRKLIVELIYRYGNFKADIDAELLATRDDVVEIGEELEELKALLESKKRESNSSENIPPGGGTSKKGWSKAKQVVDGPGSTYLKNVTSKGTRSGQSGVGPQPSGSGTRSNQLQTVLGTPQSSKYFQGSNSANPSKSGKANDSGITTVYTHTAPSPQAGSSKTANASKSASTPSKQAQKSPGPSSSRGVGTPSKPIPSSKSPSKAKSAPVGGATSNAASGKSTPAMTTNPSRTPSTPPPLPDPIVNRTTTDDSEV